MAVRMMQVEIGMVNGLFTTLGIAEQIGPIWGSISNSVLNGMDLCIELMQEAGRTGVPVTKKQAMQRIVKVLGPLGGMSPSHFAVFVAATAVLGVSGIAFVTAAGPAAVTLAGMGLFFDALGWAAAEREIRVDQHNEALRIAAQRQARAYLEAQYQKQMYSRSNRYR